MSENYMWVNLDKRQFIDPSIWGFRPTGTATSYSGCLYTDAVSTLLGGEWKGDVVVYLGESASFGKTGKATEQKLLELQLEFDPDGGTAYDHAEDLFEDVTGRFSFVKELSLEKRKHITFPSGEEIGYEGPFDIDVLHHRYVVNETKREYIDREISPVRWIYENGARIYRADPLPDLLRAEPSYFYEEEGYMGGAWIGDLIYPSNEKPVSNYMNVVDLYEFDYLNQIITVPDDLIRSAITEYGLVGTDLEVLEKLGEIFTRH